MSNASQHDAMRDAHVEELCLWPQESTYPEDFCLAVLRVMPGSS